MRRWLNERQETRGIWEGSRSPKISPQRGFGRIYNSKRGNGAPQGRFLNPEKGKTKELYLKISKFLGLNVKMGRGIFDVLISCRALDEGMNVPETRVAVIASSTASQRQRIQRFGRVLRPAEGKDGAIIYTLFATKQERNRLQKEATEFEGIAQVTWSLGKRI